MRIRFAIFATAFALLAPAPGALAQDGNPFNGIPQAQPTAAPTVAPSNTDSTAESTNSRRTRFVIGAGLLVTFFGIGWWIARDARSNLSEEEREHLRGVHKRDEGPHKHERAAKAKARAKGRAQRQARKASRNKARR